MSTKLELVIEHPNVPKERYVWNHETKHKFHLDSDDALWHHEKAKRDMQEIAESHNQAHAAASPAENAPRLCYQVCEFVRRMEKAEAENAELKAKIAELEREYDKQEKAWKNANHSNQVAYVKRVAELTRERDQAREALRAAEFQKCAKCQKSIFWFGDRWYHTFAADVKNCGEAEVPPGDASQEKK